jgi:hypothetical protein
VGDEHENGKQHQKKRETYFCAAAAATAPPASSLPSSCATEGGCFLDAGVTASRSGGTTRGIARPMPPMMKDHVMMGSYVVCLVVVVAERGGK